MAYMHHNVWSILYFTWEEARGDTRVADIIRPDR